MSETYSNIRVDNGVRRIGVNDDGEYIELSINDVQLTERFAGLLQWFDKKSAEIDEAGNKLAEKYGADATVEDESGFNADMVVDIATLRTAVYKECCERIDGVFGADACRKIFGNVLPDDVLLMEFFDQIAPVLEKLAAERGEKIKLKYQRGKKAKQRTKAQMIEAYSEKGNV